MNAPFEKIFNTFRQRTRVNRPQTPPFRRKALFEPLEPRLLLSADIASPAVVDFLASYHSDPSALSVVDKTSNPTTPVVYTAALTDTASGSVTGPETGFVQLDAADGVRHIASLDGTIDALIASSERSNEWRITGADEVTLNGVAYSGVNVLLGGANNEDRFIFEPGGSLSGFIDGGPGGADTLVGPGKNTTWQSRSRDP